MEPVNIQKIFLNLCKDPHSDIEVATLFEGEMDFIIAELKPAKTLKPHYHKIGSEYYQVLSGVGILELGKLVDGCVEWTHSHVLNIGDVIEVREGIVHQLKNSGDEVLQLVFIATKSHLNEDRYFI